MVAGSSHMAGAEYARRRAACRELMRREGLDGLVVNNLADVRYLCGFSGSSGMLLLLPRDAYLITDFRYREQSRLEVAGARPVILDDGFAEALRSILERHVGKGLPAAEERKPTAQGVAGERGTSRGGGRGAGKAGGQRRPGTASGMAAIGFSPEHMAYAEATEVRRRLRGIARVVPLQGSLALLRAPKSPMEMEIMRKGIRTAERAFRAALRGLDEKSTEAGLAAELDAAARRLGAEAPAFETIVASGKRGALVHARPSRSRLAGAAVVDWGIIREGYCTDCTRTLALGRVPRELRRAHALLLEAQERALERAAPGVKARDVDAAARGVIEAAGYGKAFGHGLGHGVGLEVHERPHLGPRSRDVLEEGMVFTNEPGIYLPGVGGVRVEDMVLVTRDGAEPLTSLPRGLDIGDYI